MLNVRFKSNHLWKLHWASLMALIIKNLPLWGRWEWGSGWGIHVNPWLIHVNVWQKPLQYCQVISLQLIKINEKKKKKRISLHCRRPKFDPGVGKISWRREWQPTPVFLPGESHGQRRLMGYSPWGSQIVGHNRVTNTWKSY